MTLNLNEFGYLDWAYCFLQFFAKDYLMTHQTNPSDRQFCGQTRRQMLWQAGGGFAGVALASMLGNQFFAAQATAADGKTSFDNQTASFDK